MDIEREAVTLTWNPPEDDGGSPITHYLLEKRDVMRAHWSHAEKTSSTTCKSKVKNLTEGTEFYFRVMAVNKIGAGIPLESRPILVKSPFGRHFSISPVMCTVMDSCSCDNFLKLKQETARVTICFNW